MTVGVDETEESERHNGHSLLCTSGRFVLNKHNLPTFTIHGHGMLDHGNLYPAHIFRDGENRLMQLEWTRLERSRWFRHKMADRSRVWGDEDAGNSAGAAG